MAVSVAEKALSSWGSVGCGRAWVARMMCCASISESSGRTEDGEGRKETYDGEDQGEEGGVG
jgi:hypothetical protein